VRYLLIALFVLTGCFRDHPPEVRIISPSDGERVIGPVIIQATARDDYGISHLRFFVGDSLIGVDSSSPYLACWETDSLPDQKTFTITAEGLDRSGQPGRDEILLIVDHSLRPPTVESFDTGEVRSTSIWLHWQVTGEESVRVYRSIAPGIDTIDDLIATLPEGTDSFHDLWLEQDYNYYYMILPVDQEHQTARSKIVKVKTAVSQTITWIPGVNGWPRDGPYDRASSPEELLTLLGDSAHSYIEAGFIDFTRQRFKGRLESFSPDTSRLSLYLFDMEDSIRARVVYDLVDPGNTIPYDSVGDEARYRFDNREAMLDFRKQNGFVRIIIDSGLPPAVKILKTFAQYVAAMI